MAEWNLQQVAKDWEVVDGRYKEDVFEFMRLHFDALLATALEQELKIAQLNKEIGELVTIQHDLLIQADIL